MAIDLDGILDAPELAGTRWSVELRYPDGTVLRHDPELLQHTASVAKLFLLTEVAAQLADGRLAADETVRRDAVAPMYNSGIWQWLGSAPELSIADAALLVGAVSDNWATNVLIERVGLAAVQRRGREFAQHGTQLLDLVREDRAPTDPPTLSVGCAADWAAFMEQLGRREVVSADVSKQVIRWLAPGFDLSMVASAFALDPLAHSEDDRGVTVVSKTGTEQDVRADVGFVEGPAGLCAYAAIATWETGDLRDPVLGAMRTIGEEIRTAVGA